MVLPRVGEWIQVSSLPTLEALPRGTKILVSCSNEKPTAVMPSSHCRYKTKGVGNTMSYEESILSYGVVPGWWIYVESYPAEAASAAPPGRPPIGTRRAMSDAEMTALPIGTRAKYHQATGQIALIVRATGHHLRYPWKDENTGEMWAGNAGEIEIVSYPTIDQESRWDKPRYMTWGEMSNIPEGTEAIYTIDSTPRKVTRKTSGHSLWIGDDGCRWSGQAGTIQLLAAPSGPGFHTQVTDSPCADGGCSDEKPVGSKELPMSQKNVYFGSVTRVTVTEKGDPNRGIPDKTETSVVLPLAQYEGYNENEVRRQLFSKVHGDSKLAAQLDNLSGLYFNVSSPIGFACREMSV